MKNILVPITVLLLLVSCNIDRSSETALSGEALGTTYQIKYYALVAARDVESGLDSIFKAVNNSMSTYQKDSDISKINTGDTTIAVDLMFQEVLKLSKRIHKETNGYFDPTVGNLVNAYGFGAERFQKPIDSVQIDSLMQFVGLDNMSLTDGNRIKKTNPKVYLEFNAIAKGYCIDRIAAYLDDKGIKNYLVELGGELIAKGRKQQEDGNMEWVAGIEAPNQDGSRSIAKKVRLKNRAMATSGNYRKYKVDTESGNIYVHTINPLTGYPEINDMISASVFANTCAEADAYATAFMALGFEKSLSTLEKLEEVDVFLMYLNSENKLQTFTSEGIKKEVY